MLLEEERDKKKQEFWKNLKEGQVVYGFVRNIMDYGAFVDLGGVDGFVISMTLPGVKLHTRKSI